MRESSKLIIALRNTIWCSNLKKIAATEFAPPFRAGLRVLREGSHPKHVGVSC